MHAAPEKVATLSAYIYMCVCETYCTCVCARGQTLFITKQQYCRLVKASGLSQTGAREIVTRTEQERK